MAELRMSPPSNSRSTGSPEAGRDGTTEQPGSSAPSRPRYLRACDRCRLKKTKCDDKQPCGGCVRWGTGCTFNLSNKTPVLGEQSSSRKRKASHVSPRDDDSESSTSQKARTTSAPTLSKPRPSNRSTADLSQGSKLDLASSIHFFSSHDGITRMMGPTSGLALLEAARLISDVAKQKTSSQPMHDWEMMSRLLGPQEAETGEEHSPKPTNDEYFPDREGQREPVDVPVNVLEEITSVIPLDLLASLINTFFEVVHPSWPIVHVSTFFEDLYKWSDPACGMLVVAMCMLSSRHSTDLRVYTGMADPASAGRHYHAVFERLSRHKEGNDLYQTIAYFFAAQYFCTDNVPESRASEYFGVAFAKHVDMGLYRNVPPNVQMSDIQREVRKRIGWAIFCWDKQIAALLGRHAFNRLFQISIDMPKPFVDGSQASELRPLLLDRCYVEIFEAFISISAVLDITLNHLSPHASFSDTPFMDELARSWNLEKYEEGLRLAEDKLERWRRHLPPSLSRRDINGRFASPLHSIASEQVAGTELLIELLIGARRLFIATVYGPGATTDDTREHDVQLGKSMRVPLIAASKELLHSGIQLGSAGKLEDTDILFVYRLLLAGRILLSCNVCAKVDGNRDDMNDCRRAIQAALMLLYRLADRHPYTLGAAETLEETCRICSFNVTPGARARSDSGMSKRLWYRPLGRSNALSQSPEVRGLDQSALETTPGQTTSKLPAHTPSHSIYERPLSGYSAPGLVGTSSSSGFDDTFGSFGQLPDGFDIGWLLTAGLSDMGTGITADVADDHN